MESWTYVLACEWLCAVEVSITVLTFCKLNIYVCNIRHACSQLVIRVKCFNVTLSSVFWKCHFEKVKLRPREINLTNRV
jgi:hypothetical protein